MTLIIECETLRQSYRWTLRPGECARIGRSPWIEFSITEDLAMANEHLQIDYSHHPAWKWIAPPPENVTSTLDEALRVSNQTTFILGSSQFKITWVQRLLHESRSHELSDVESTTVCEAQPWKADRVGLVELGIKTDVIKQLDGYTSRIEAVLCWKEQGQMQEALRLIAWELDHENRITWLIKSLPKDRIAPDVVGMMNAWIFEPSELHRQTAAQWMGNLQTSAPEYWSLGAIAWTGGSLGPATSPVVTPPRSLPVLAAITALQLTASQFSEFDVIEKAIAIGLEILRVEDSSTCGPVKTGDLDACRS
jgi:hypothetical protein